MQKLEITPAPCLICGMGNTPNDLGEPRLFVDLERDVNWNDPAILCEDCLSRAAGMIGMLSRDTLVAMKREIKEKDKALHAAQVEMDAMKKRARKLGIAFTEPESTAA